MAERVNDLTGENFKANTISNYENAVSEPSLKVVVAISKILEISVDFLLGLIDERSAHPSAHPSAHLINEAKTKDVEKRWAPMAAEDQAVYRGSMMKKSDCEALMSDLRAENDKLKTQVDTLLDLIREIRVGKLKKNG